MKALLLTPDGRRAGAFLVVLGGCIVMTIYAGADLYILRDDAKHAFWLGMMAHLHILLGLTAFSALWIRRSIKVSRSGLDISDTPEAAGAAAAAEVAKAGAEASAVKADEITEKTA